TGGGEGGIEIKWNGTRLSFTQIGGGTVNGPPELEKNTFVDSSVEVSSSGFATFNYDTYSTSAQIPGYAGLSLNMFAFAGRTGGASEDAWIDNLRIAGFAPPACGGESGQTVHFVVSNDNPSLFEVQPGIDANGTLTY